MSPPCLPSPCLVRPHVSSYLNSRYYDPCIGRFINAYGLVSTGQGVLSYNMVAYCLNDPVNNQIKSVASSGAFQGSNVA